MTDIKTFVLYVGGQPSLITLDYVMKTNDGKEYKFRLSYYPHKLSRFTDILSECFDYNMKHRIFGDFKPLNECKNPAFFIHVVEKL